MTLSILYSFLRVLPDRASCVECFICAPASMPQSMECLARLLFHLSMGTPCMQRKVLCASSQAFAAFFLVYLTLAGFLFFLVFLVFLPLPFLPLVALQLRSVSFLSQLLTAHIPILPDTVKHAVRPHPPISRQ